MKKIIVLLFGIFFQINNLFAQNTEKIEMADLMRSNGKIYVVVAVLGIILLGVLLYLIRLDTKISKIEKEME